MPTTAFLTNLPSPTLVPKTLVTESLFWVCLTLFVSFFKSFVDISFPSSYIVQVVSNTLESTPISLTYI